MTSNVAANSTWTQTGELAAIGSQNIYLGNGSGGSTQMTISGGTLTDASILYVGLASPATVTVGNSETLIGTGATYVGYGAGGGTLNTGGTVSETGSIIVGNETAAVRLTSPAAISQPAAAEMPSTSASLLARPASSISAAAPLRYDEQFRLEREPGRFGQWRLEPDRRHRHRGRRFWQANTFGTHRHGQHQRRPVNIAGNVNLAERVRAPGISAAARGQRRRHPGPGRLLELHPQGNGTIDLLSGGALTAAALTFNYPGQTSYGTATLISTAAYCGPLPPHLLHDRTHGGLRPAERGRHQSPTASISPSARPSCTAAPIPSMAV